MSKKTKKEVVVVKELSQGELQKLAHSGTKEAIEKIEKYIKIEKDYDKRAYAEMALEECEMFFYQPKNEKEDEEFTLSELIRRKERYIDDQTMKMCDIKERIEKLMLEKKVHEKVLAKHKNKKEEWKYNWMQDFVSMEENELHKIEEDLGYDEAWVAEAKKMITTARYKNMPARQLGHFNFNFGEDYFDDEKDDCDCENNCDCEDVFKGMV
ncbi:MAG: hypothetical protein WC678_00715 [Parcubacteria group bacterium]|jgi:hypothetical protein